MDKSQSYSTIISNKKIIATLKKVWIKSIAIIVCAVILSAVIGVIQYKQEKIGVYTTNPQYYHGYIYVSANWDDEPQLDDASIENMYEKYAVQSYIEQKHNDIINETRMLLYEDEIKAELNKRLEENEYDLLNAEDVFNITVGSARYFIMTVDSKSSEERTKYLIEQATDIVIKEAMDRFGLANCELQPSETYPEKKDGTLYKKIDIITTKQSMFTAIKSASTTKNIMMVGIAAVVLIIIVSILKDKKLYDKTEIEPYIGAKCLYDTSSNKSIAISIIEAKCKANQINNLSIISCDNIKQNNGLVVMGILDELKGSGMAIDLCQNAKDMSKVLDNDGAILVVQKEIDKGIDIYNVMQTLKTAEVNVLGYIWL